MTKVEIVGKKRKEAYADLLKKSKIGYTATKVGKAKWVFNIKK